MSRFWKSVLKKLLILCGGLFLLCFGIYSAIWVTFVFFYQDKIDLLWEKIQSENHFVLSGAKPDVSGFPHAPTIIYSGVVTSPEGLKLEFPHLEMTGFPVSYQRQYIHADQGFTLSAPFLERVMTIDSAKMYLRLPNNPPLSDRFDDIESWQKKSDPFRIEYFSFTTLGVLVEGGGELALDEKLQLKGLLNIRVDGMPELLDRIEQDNPSSKENLKMARAVVQMMTQTDPKTGKAYFVTTARLENQGVYLGPLKIFPLPYLAWGRPQVTEPRLKPE